MNTVFFKGLAGIKIHDLRVNFVVISSECFVIIVG